MTVLTTSQEKLTVNYSFPQTSLLIKIICTLTLSYSAYRLVCKRNITPTIETLGGKKINHLFMFLFSIHEATISYDQTFVNATTSDKTPI